ARDASGEGREVLRGPVFERDVPGEVEQGGVGGCGSDLQRVEHGFSSGAAASWWAAVAGTATGRDGVVPSRPVVGRAGSGVDTGTARGGEHVTLTRADGHPDGLTLLRDGAGVDTHDDLRVTGTRVDVLGGGAGTGELAVDERVGAELLDE